MSDRPAGEGVGLYDCGEREPTLLDGRLGDRRGIGVSDRSAGEGVGLYDCGEREPTLLDGRL